jgi:hypothetical protein
VRASDAEPTVRFGREVINRPNDEDRKPINHVVYSHPHLVFLVYIIGAVKAPCCLPSFFVILFATAVGAQSTCDRTCMTGPVDRYLAAMVS